ncbi:recombinase family protein [Aeromonas salmonicida]|uniref:recombinase family protein n=1 Tax=Aeromonas salmonicida TaxID=645 RepID=UPI001F41A63E|nr:recombinase family protein [Aeromonas salmonicida]
MSNRVFAYLRASTKEQDALRAKEPLLHFANERQFQIDGWFQEHESGAMFTRPELFRLLELAKPGDILLVEQVDRLSRLDTPDWERLKMLIKGKELRVVALDLPTSWAMLTPSAGFQERMLAAINDMMLDMLAAIARKDYEDRRRRQAEGIAKAKQAGRYKGRPVDTALHDRVRLALNGVVAQISQQIMISPAPSDRYTRGFLTGRPRVFSLFIALTYAITSPT